MIKKSLIDMAEIDVEYKSFFKEILVGNFFILLLLSFILVSIEYFVIGESGLIWALILLVKSFLILFSILIILSLLKRFKRIGLNSFYIVAIFLSLEGLNYLYFSIQIDKILEDNDYLQTIYIPLYIFILAFILFSFLSFAYDKAELLFRYIFKFRAFNIIRHDIYTNKRDLYFQIEKHQKESKSKTDVYFLVTTLISQNKIEKDKNFKKLRRNIIKFIYFWYAYEFDRAYLQFVLPIFAILLSFITFAINLFILTEMNFGEYTTIITFALAVLFLIILYVAMSLHLNTLLNPASYLLKISNLFKKSSINFGSDMNQKNKFMIFIDKNFLIHIYDRKYDREFNLNSSEKFEKFLLTGNIDEVGKNNIINIFAFLFIILYITSFAVVLDNKTLSSTDINISKKIEIYQNIKNLLKVEGDNHK